MASFGKFASNSGTRLSGLVLGGGSTAWYTGMSMSQPSVTTLDCSVHVHTTTTLSGASLTALLPSFDFLGHPVRRITTVKMITAATTATTKATTASPTMIGSIKLSPATPTASGLEVTFVCVTSSDVVVCVLVEVDPEVGGVGVVMSTVGGVVDGTEMGR